ncbi:MAG: hypothetical protein GW763_13535 [Paraglaciecola sp.]|nr:hypothetical protein [Paraglaciecola sp.]NCT48982.1 hypothetical protein [Paraglaciecola sp.]
MKTVYLLGVLGLSTQTSLLFAQDSAAIEVSGFVRLVGGILDDSDAAYQGYENSLSFSQHSLLGLQIDANITDRWSITTQLVAHSANNNRSSIEWLYTTYQLNNAWQFKVGKLRAPFFN